jgi:hypothetical protein
VKFKDLRSALNELTTKINLYKLINNNKHGFVNAIYSTFNEIKKGRTTRESNKQSQLFLDPKTNKSLSSVYDSEIELLGDRLVLSPSKRKVSISEISEKFGGDFKQSVYTLNNEEKPDTKKMIDSTDGTFWRRTIRRTAQDETVKVKLELKLNGTREINYLEIEPDVSEMVLESINFISREGVLTEILSATESYTIKKDMKIPFAKIFTDTIILEFLIVNNTEESYQNPESQNFNPLEEYVSDAVKNEILESYPDLANPFICYEYKIGIDNIRVGLDEYIDTGIYVSAPLSLKEETGTLGLIVKEQRPYLDANQMVKYVDSFDSSKAYIGSLEYWIIKEDLDSDKEDANVIGTNTFPIYPMGREEIFHERLVLTEISEGSIRDTGYLMHYPDIAKILTVYRNGTSFTSSTVTQTENSPLGNYRMRYKIIIPTVNPGDIFTVSYSPLKSNSYSNTWSSASTIEQIDLVGNLTVRVGPEGLILMDESKDERIEGYRVYLVVISRQNTARKEITPILEEYTLAVGKRNLKKFEEV